MKYSHRTPPKRSKRMYLCRSPGFCMKRRQSIRLGHCMSPHIAKSVMPHSRATMEIMREMSLKSFSSPSS